MTEPSGKIVARPMVVRACGHKQEFQHYEIDKYRQQRLQKFQRTRCSACVAELVEKERQASAALPSAKEAMKNLPPGTQVALTRRADGAWVGTLTVDGHTVEFESTQGAGPASVLGALAKEWMMKVSG